VTERGLDARTASLTTALLDQVDPGHQPEGPTGAQLLGEQRLGCATLALGVITGLQERFDWRGVAASAVGAGVGEAVAPGLARAFGSDPMGQFATRMTTGLVAGTAAAVMRGGRVAIQQVAVDAFGNALATSLVDSMTRDPLGDFINKQEAAQQQRDSAAAAAASSLGSGLRLGGGQGLRFYGSAIDDWSNEIDGGILLTAQRDADIDAAQAAELAQARNAQALARSNARARNNNANYGHEGRGSVAPAPFAGRSTITDPAAYANPELAMDGSLSGAELAGRFGKGLLGAVKSVTVEPLLQVRDLGLAGASVAYNELLRSNDDAMWLPEMKSGMADAYANGASQTRLVLQSNQLTGIGVVSYDLTTAAMNRDWGTVAEMGGGLVGGLAIGKGVSKYGGYGLTFDDIGASGPGASQMGAVKISLVTPNSAAGRLLVANNEGMFYPEVPDLRTGRPIQFPVGEFAKVDKANRTTWDSSANRYAYIKEWNDRGYEAPVGGWKEYDIHHIQPLEYGGSNSFWNLVPVQRQTHLELFNKFWRGY